MKVTPRAGCTHRARKEKRKKRTAAVGAREFWREDVGRMKKVWKERANVAAEAAPAEAVAGQAPEREEEAGSAEGKRAKRIFGVRASTLFLICYIAAFLGWWVENIFRSFSAGVFDSRHQLLPFLGAYGFGIFVMFFIFGTPTEMRVFKKRILPERTAKNHILRGVIYCALMFVLILFGEMGMGMLFEKVFGVKAWNYTSIPLHITRYTSIPTTLAFTAGIFLLMQFAFPHAVKLIDKIPDKTAFVLALVLGILIAADWLIMIISGLVNGKFPDYWSIRFG